LICFTVTEDRSPLRSEPSAVPSLRGTVSEGVVFFSLPASSRPGRPSGNRSDKPQEPPEAKRQSTFCDRRDHSRNGANRRTDNLLL
jgi:hypothetical protein